MSIEVVICTYNPRKDYLDRTIAALRQQTLDTSQWRLLIVDNASSEPLDKSVDLSWHPHARVIREEKLGLTHARLRAVREAQGQLLIFSDDDTVFRPDYLAIAREKFEHSPTLGVAGGRSLPEFEGAPAKWFNFELAPLGCRDLGDVEQIAHWTHDTKNTYPVCSPIGAGMIIRREAIEPWAALATKDPKRQALGRTGAALSSGEDNDINLVALANGWAVGYLPELRLTHLIPTRRLDAKYLEKLSFASSRDWVRVLSLHGVSIWPPIPSWTVPLRKIKAWFSYHAWSGAAQRIQWCGACGHFEGRASMDRT